MFCHHYIPSGKIARPKMNVTAFSDHLLVEWTSLSKNCEVKYNKVCPPLITWRHQFAFAVVKLLKLYWIKHNHFNDDDYQIRSPYHKQGI